MQTEKCTTHSLTLAIAGVAVVAILIAIIGFVFMNRPASYIEGQVEGTNVRISGKLPGRVTAFYVSEGDSVHAGDTLVYIHSSLVEAKLGQAEAMREAARQQSLKADAGARAQVIHGAAELVAKAKAAETITQKTYQRMERLFEQGVVAEQKRDEAKAAYDAAVASLRAAESQLSLAEEGAQSEDKAAAAALASAAKSTVDEVNAVLEDSYLTAPFDGTIDQIYPEIGELVNIGAPIMSLLRSGDRHIVFNIREQLLANISEGTQLKVTIPALGMKEITVEVYYIRDMGNYATHHATKSTGSYDSRTFQIKARPLELVTGLRPGMTAIFPDPEK